MSRTEDPPETAGIVDSRTVVSTRRRPSHRVEGTPCDSSWLFEDETDEETPGIMAADTAADERTVVAARRQYKRLRRSRRPSRRRPLATTASATTTASRSMDTRGTGGRDISVWLRSSRQRRLRLRLRAWLDRQRHPRPGVSA